MVGLIIRIVVLAAVVFGVAFGVSRALKLRAQSEEHAKILERIEQLRAGLEAGLYAQDEYARLRVELQEACREAGLEVPALPERINSSGAES